MSGSKEPTVAAHRQITQDDVRRNIASEHYFTADPINFCEDGMLSIGDASGHAHKQLRMLTFCVLVLRNGHTVTGESYCANQDKFDKTIGQLLARDAALAKVAPLMVYALRDRMATP